MFYDAPHSYIIDLVIRQALTVAMDYDHLAKLAEEQIADKERGTIDANTGRPAPDAIDLSRFSALAGR